MPLRLLAREVYNKAVDRVGVDAVALITGEEKIKPANPRFWVSTVEAMPRDLDVAFLAVDEIQLGADLERGHVFTDRMLHRRGREETLVLGAFWLWMLLADWRGYLIAWLTTVAVSNVYLAAYARLRVEIRKERVESQEAEKRIKKAS